MADGMNLLPVTPYPRWWPEIADCDVTCCNQITDSFRQGL